MARRRADSNGWKLRTTSGNTEAGSGWSHSSLSTIPSRGVVADREKGKKHDMSDYDVSLIQPIVRTAVEQHPERERLQELLNAGVQVRVRELEPHPEEPPADNLDEVEYQAFLEHDGETIPIAIFPGYALRSSIIGKNVGAAHIDVVALQRPMPQVRITINWPEAHNMSGVDLLLSRDEARDLAENLGSAARLVQEMLDELGGWGD